MKLMYHFSIIRKNAILLLLILILLLSFLSFSVMATESKFFNKSEDTFTIQAGTWWDGSDLSITDELQELEACPTYNISFTIHNSGFDMLDSTTYQLYFSADGTPSDSGTVVENGTLFPILENDTNVVVFSDLIEGHYQLKVNQRPMYQDEEGTQQFVWSEILTVACEDEEQPNEELEENETLTDSADIPEDIEEKIIEKKSPEEELKEIQNEEKDINEHETEEKQNQNDFENTPVQNEDKTAGEDTTPIDQQKPKEPAKEEGEEDGTNTGNKVQEKITTNQTDNENSE